MTPKEIYDAALFEVNSLRQRLGMEPLGALPKGVPGDGGKCPIQRALNCAAMVEDKYIVMMCSEDAVALGSTLGSLVDTPQALAAFIAAFDNLVFPDLIEREGRDIFA